MRFFCFIALYCISWLFEKASFSQLRHSIRTDLLKKYFDYQHLIDINISSKKALKRFSNEDIRNSKVIVRFLPVHFVFYEKIAIFAVLTESSLRHCRIKNWKETRSFLIRSPFDTYPSQTSNNQDFTICEMILCGDLRFSHCQGHRYRQTREE